MKQLNFALALILSACGAPSNQTPERPVAEPSAPESNDCDPACFHVDDRCVRQTAGPHAFTDCGAGCCPTAGVYTDTDGDGHIGELDQCPEEPEDRDSFEDMDGCPDPDNDADGIADREDGCPLIPEDFDGQDDGDGCPEGVGSDVDGDGMLDDMDKCPDDPEDLDGFQDGDGCPDLDNDGDGVMDVDDLCPNHPEDPDGVQDADGCPDLY